MLSTQSACQSSLALSATYHSGACPLYTTLGQTKFARGAIFRGSAMSTHHIRASRRLLLQFLAASPLFARAALAEGLRSTDPAEWAPRDFDKLIADPKEALDVFDFEPVMKKNVPPAHFGYMATGADDEVTLRANRESFRKFALRPRRLVDVSNVDMSLELFGAKYDSP